MADEKQLECNPRNALAAESGAGFESWNLDGQDANGRLGCVHYPWRIVEWTLSPS
jgi:hypothetical protein